MRADIRRRVCLAAVVAMLSPAIAAGAEKITYNRDIRPILVENCLSCHGADSASRKADLRLDLRDAAIDFGAIVPGDPDSSPILDRIHSDDPDVVMPPPAMKKTLTAEQKRLLSRWIAAGAEYEPHWSFIPPRRPELPAVRNESWVRNPIDRFILARLEQDGLAPAPEADRRALARRVALDLTGLPPEPTVMEAFVADERPDAYERLVDALLAMTEWGEHRGRYWLDYARYADTHGIHYDNYREMWSYRQWVVDAFNANMPFDRFTVRQLAGDLLPVPQDDGSAGERLVNQIASGFNRCNMTTNEGGAIDEEYLTLYTRDRTETTATVWMGLTTGCAVCHDHKFDPLSQREFYELSAFFNNTTQKAMDGNVKDTPPVVIVPSPDDRPRFAALEREISGAKAAVESRRKAARPDFEAWAAGLTADRVRSLGPQDSPLVELPLADGAGTGTQARLSGKDVSLPLSAETTWQEGPGGRRALLLDGQALTLADAGDFELKQPFSASFWIRPAANDSTYAVLARMDADAAQRGWGVTVQGRRIAVQLAHAWPDQALRVVAKDQLKADAWTLVTATYDGSGGAGGIKIFHDGKAQNASAETKSLRAETIKSQAPLAIGGNAEIAAHGVGLADLRLWGRALAAGEVEALAKTYGLDELIALPADERAGPAGQFFEWWLTTQDVPFRDATGQQQTLEQEREVIRKRGTVAHVMNERGEPAEAFILDRGEYDKRKDKVQADTPDILPLFPADKPRNRLGLAEWLLLAEHPLTSRVTVNRFWQETFGTGLVRTSGDFGITGELPSHPELLDWLAVEFQAGGWDVKKFFRLLVTSAAYRQAAMTTPEKLVKDAANRLLSRGPRFRMDAEMLRDQALAASGLLVRRVGGPSVKPYQPDGVWEAVSMGGDTRSYKRDTGEANYRRSLYWFWKRSAPPASLEILNAPSREVCCVKRERTNTPLQALVTLNDPQFVEAARVLADAALAIEGTDARIDFLARRLLGRPLADAEAKIVRRSTADLVAWYATRPEDARSLVAVGEAKPRAGDVQALAAWTMLANELMNLDEVLCK